MQQLLYRYDASRPCKSALLQLRTHSSALKKKKILEIDCTTETLHKCSKYWIKIIYNDTEGI